MRVVDNERQSRRWVVSGGIGSGKSTVMRILEELGAVVIEADRIGHDILEPGGEAFAEVVRRWPQAVSDGHIDRKRLASIVFTDDEELGELEAITHPLIGAAIAARVAAAADRDVVVELPLATDLVGSGWTRVVVDAPVEERAERSMRRGMDAGDVARRIAAQPGREQWLAWADIVIDNSGTLRDLRERVEKLWLQEDQLRDPP